MLANDTTLGSVALHQTLCNDSKRFCIVAGNASHADTQHVDARDRNHTATLRARCVVMGLIASRACLKNVVKTHT